MKTFRGKEVEGWRIIDSRNRDDFQSQINRLMEEFNFEDFQYGVTPVPGNKDGPEFGFLYSAAILLSKKRNNEYVRQALKFKKQHPTMEGAIE